MRILVLFIIVFILVSCGTNEDGKIQSDDIQSSGILMREGPQEINIGAGTTPLISWGGGNICELIVSHFNTKIEKWCVIWAIQGEFINKTETDPKGGPRIISIIGPLDTISSPITYGTIPLKATEYYKDEPKWVFETFKTGEKYSIVIFTQTKDNQGNYTPNYSSLYFIR